MISIFVVKDETLQGGEVEVQLGMMSQLRIFTPSPTKLLEWPNSSLADQSKLEPDRPTSSIQNGGWQPVSFRRSFSWKVHSVFDTRSE